MLSGGIFQTSTSLKAMAATKMIVGCAFPSISAQFVTTNTSVVDWPILRVPYPIAQAAVGAARGVMNGVEVAAAAVVRGNGRRRNSSSR
mmetsp:Transcript_41449/g.74719  ORF Transcript_41449/g.74719 Transcript_41449/m.74719 type:complete len:89 (-) Transcript_41449:193-459(-)